MTTPRRRRTAVAAPAPADPVELAGTVARLADTAEQVRVMAAAGGRPGIVGLARQVERDAVAVRAMVEALWGVDA